MPRFEDTIEVEVPVRVAYDHWTRFREFPHFMEHVESVELLDPTTLRWVARSGGRQRLARVTKRGATGGRDGCSTKPVSSITTRASG